MSDGGLRVRVYATARGQGNHRTNAHGATYETTVGHKDWRAAVTAAARREAGPGWEPLAGPVKLDVTFYVHRPRNHFRSGRFHLLLKPTAPPFPTVTPDLSKLVRSTEDSLTDALVWLDDKLVVVLVAHKEYGVPGAKIVVTPYPYPSAAPVAGTAEETRV